MYIEDNDNTRFSIERFLKRRFGKVFLAENAEKGIELFHQFNPDIAIVDILLPGMGGLEMIRKIRETNSSCKFLITSTVTEAATILEAVDLDIENYIVKPIDTEVFEEKLRRIGKSILDQRDRACASKSFDFENKKEFEEKLRKQFIKILKERSGKGPRDAVVFISSDAIEISAYGVLSAIEKTLLSDIKNTGHVEEGRRLFYQAIQNNLSDMIHQATGAFVELQNIKVDARQDKEVSRFLLANGS